MNTIATPSPPASEHQFWIRVVGVRRQRFIEIELLLDDDLLAVELVLLPHQVLELAALRRAQFLSLSERGAPNADLMRDLRALEDQEAVAALFDALEAPRVLPFPSLGPSHLEERGASVEAPTSALPEKH